MNKFCPLTCTQGYANISLYVSSEQENLHIIIVNSQVQSQAVVLQYACNVLSNSQAKILNTSPPLPSAKIQGESIHE